MVLAPLEIRLNTKSIKGEVCVFHTHLAVHFDDVTFNRFTRKASIDEHIHGPLQPSFLLALLCAFP